jgi:hypothetical protein|tara:strand:- start:37 stop:261 length:225 start_codon:yes stop_codon:yes gene_type:complete
MVNVTTDQKGADLILKALRLVRVYQERESSWISIEDKLDAKTLTDKIEVALRKSKETKVIIDDPKCDPDTNCDW